MADQPTIQFPEGMSYEPNPSFDDKIMLRKATGGDPVYSNVEDFMSASASQILGTATPSDSPTGSETNGQSYRVSNTKAVPDPNDGSNDDTYTNFLTNVSDGSGGFLPVVVPASTSGLLTKSGGSWVFVKDASATKIINSLDSDDTTAALGADQGKLVVKRSSVIAKPGNNQLFNKDGLIPFKWVNTSGIVADASTEGVKMAPPILLDPNQTDITFSGMPVSDSGSRKYYTFYDSDDNPIADAFGHIDDAASLTLPIPAGAVTLYFTGLYDGQDASILDNVMVNYGTTALPYEDFVEYLYEVDGKKVQQVNLNNYYDKEEVNEIVPRIGYTGGKNIYDPSMLFPGFFVSIDNTINAVGSGNWKTAVVPLDHSNPDTSSKVGIVGWINNQIRIVLGINVPPPSGADLSLYDSQISSVISPTRVNGEVEFDVTDDITWIAFSPSNATDTPDAYANLGVYMGGIPTSLGKGYVKTINETDILGNALIDSEGNIHTTDEILNGGSVGAGSIKLTITEGSENAIMEMDYKGSHYIHTVAPFRPLSFLNSNVFDYRGMSKNGVSVQNEVDDTPPVQMASTDAFANHSWVGMDVTATAHGKDFPDVGSLWMWNGLEVQLMAILGVNNLLLSRTNSNESISTPGTLTHVQGATNTADFAVSGIAGANTYRLCPSIKNRIMNIFVDDVLIDPAVAGTYFGNKISFAEYYEGMDKQSMHDWLLTQVGTTTEITQFDGTAIIGRSHIHTFYPDLTNSVACNEVALQAIPSFQAYIMAQAQTILGTGLKVYFPKTLPKSWMGSTRNFNLPVTVPATVTEAVTFQASDIEPGIAADRMIQLNDVIGFAEGVLPILDQSIELRRENATDRYFSLSTSKKHYLVGLDRTDVTSLAKNNVFSYVYYKAYFTLSENRTAFYVIQHSNNFYAYFDWHIDIVDTVEVDSRLAGKEYEVIEKSDNVTILTKVASTVLQFDVAAAGSYGYAILKFSK